MVIGGSKGKWTKLLFCFLGWHKKRPPGENKSPHTHRCTHMFTLLKATKGFLLFYVKSAEECQRTEKDAIKIAAEMNAEFWSVSSKTGTIILHVPCIIKIFLFEYFSVLNHTDSVCFRREHLRVFLSCSSFGLRRCHSEWPGDRKQHRSDRRWKYFE